MRAPISDSDRKALAHVLDSAGTLERAVDRVTLGAAFAVDQADAVDLVHLQRELRSIRICLGAVLKGEESPGREREMPF